MQRGVLGVTWVALTLFLAPLAACGGDPSTDPNTTGGSATGDATGAATGATGGATGGTTGGATGTSTGTASAYPIPITVLSLDARCEGDPGTKDDLLVVTPDSEAIEIIHRGIVASVCAEWGVMADQTGAMEIEVVYEDAHTTTKCDDTCWWYLDYRLHDVPPGTYTLWVDGIEEITTVLP